MTPHIPSDTARTIVRLVLACLVLQLVVVGYDIIHNYKERTHQVSDNREACERGKKDRAANAEGWRTAETARLSTVAEQLDISFAQAKALEKHELTPDDPPDLIAARKYDKIAFGLEKRSKISCAQAFPKADFFP